MGWFLAFQWLGCGCSHSHALAQAHACRGGKCNAVRKSALKGQAEGPEEANTWSCTELFPSACARQGRSPSAGLVSLASVRKAHGDASVAAVACSGFAGRALRERTSRSRRVPEDGGSLPAGAGRSRPPLSASSYLACLSVCRFAACSLRMSLCVVVRKRLLASHEFPTSSVGQ